MNFRQYSARPNPGDEQDRDGSEHRERRDIAIIGMACRFPGADDYRQYWDNLCKGLSGVREVPANRWDAEAYYSTDPREKNKSTSKWGGFVDGVEYFDADFFGISAREAQVMDPQQRLMLEQAWSCIEDAGYDPKAFSGSRTGVYVGVFTFDYRDRLGRMLDSIEGHVSTGTHTALIPNRISYFLNLHGPSLPIDTACSSSLVALHKAANAIRRGECDSALVGGVSVLCSPTHFISFSKTGMLSPDGSCKTFDESANGYVRGEGAAMILIKPLEQAIRDQDRIAAVLRGSAVNHGGRARTVTYPGSLAQSNVIAAALREADVPVGSVSYVEAHGTGTPKGDPIEVEGLKLAFARVAQERGEVLAERSCGLGSVKTNIGHLESVAGLAGLIKVIQCMRHQALPPLLHYRRLNPRIAFDGSPFHVIDSARSWPALTDGQGRAVPRRAGISSFGFGGVNAHVVIEEYRASAWTEEDAVAEPALVLLSARTSEVLRDSARRLLEAIASTEVRQAGLADLAYTLQLGRRPMAVRLALVANSLEDLEARLRAWLAHGGTAGGVLCSTLTPDALAQAEQASQQDDALASLLCANALDALASKWIEGMEPDWSRLHAGRGRRRLALPTYPFVREKHWIEAQPPVDREVPQAAMHPLLHRNTSNVFGLRFSSRFTGSESSLADHVVQGERTLPAAAQLEMLRSAVEHAGIAVGGFRLQDVMWLRPITVGAEPLELHVALFPAEQGSYRFELFHGDDGEEGVVYGEGMVVPIVSAAVAGLDLQAWRRQCSARQWQAQACYAAFERMGLHYGPAHRGLQELLLGDGVAMARLALPQANGCVLHPGMLDAALQAVVAVHAEKTEGLDQGVLRLPFALGSLEVLQPCTENMWAIVRSQASAGTLPKFDVDLCDESGAICARLVGFCVRATAAEEPVRTAILHQAWYAEPAAAAATEFAGHLVLCCEDVVDMQHLRAQLPAARLVALPNDADWAGAYGEAAATLLEQLRSLGRDPRRQLVQLVVPNDGAGQLYAGLGGMLRTAQLEYPHITAQVIGVEEGLDLAQVLLENRGSGARQIRYRQGIRQVAR